MSKNTKKKKWGRWKRLRSRLGVQGSRLDGTSRAHIPESHRTVQTSPPKTVDLEIQTAKKKAMESVILIYFDI